MYALIKDQKIEKWPYSLGQLRNDNPNTSFPSDADDALLAEWGVLPVQQTAVPTVDHTKTVEQGTPVFQDGAWVQVWNVVDASADELQQRIESKATQIRAERNNKLAACDWTQLQDAPLTLEQKAAWSVYRQALRDVSAQSGFPWEVQWPAVPA